MSHNQFLQKMNTKIQCVSIKSLSKGLTPSLKIINIVLAQNALALFVVQNSLLQSTRTFLKNRIFQIKESESTLEKFNSIIEKKMSNMPNSEVYKSFLSENQTISNPNAVKNLIVNIMHTLSLSFLILFKNSRNMEQLAGGFQLNCDFLTTIRAIFDGKLNDFMQQKFTKSASFSSFTYAWLLKQKINRKTKKIIALKGDLDKQVIPHFFMNLMGEKLNCNWEIITFRENF